MSSPMHSAVSLHTSMPFLTTLQLLNSVNYKPPPNLILNYSTLFKTHTKLIHALHLSINNSLMDNITLVLPSITTLSSHVKHPFVSLSLTTQHFVLNYSVKFMKHHLLVTLGFTNSTLMFNDTSLAITSNVMFWNSLALALNAKSLSLAITSHLEPSCHFSLLKNRGKMSPWISLFTSRNHRHLTLSLSLLIVSPKWHTLSQLRHRSTHLNSHNSFSTTSSAYMVFPVASSLTVILVSYPISGVNYSL